MQLSYPEIRAIAVTNANMIINLCMTHNGAVGDAIQGRILRLAEIVNELKAAEADIARVEQADADAAAA